MNPVLGNTFYDRLEDERLQLANKMEKLEYFINSEKFSDIDVIQQSLLRIQLLSMSTYHQCLVERIEWLK